jgi:acyl CoA:acetate/3-ketoacid CoA transferase beta subunit
MSNPTLNDVTTEELMVFAASKEVHDNEVALIGTGLPMIAAYLAKATHAPNTVLIFESGVMDTRPRHIATGVGDFPLVNRAAKTSTLFDALSLLQLGEIDLGFLGAAEIDQYGNINTTVIGPYEHPKVRLPGSGGANDIASLAGRVVVIARHKRKTFPERVNYLTTPGFLRGAREREKAGLRGEGPRRVITNLGVFGFDEDTKRMKVVSLHPEVSPEQVQENTQFQMLFNDGETPVTEIPPPDILQIIRELDKDRIYIGKE